MSVLDNIIFKGNAVTRRGGSISAAIAGSVMLALTFLVVVDVTLRYVFSNPIPGGTESTELLLNWIVLLALGYTLAVGGHVRVTLILHRLSSRTRLGVEVLDCVIGMVFCGIMTYVGWLFFWDSFIIREFMMAQVKLPYWVGKMAMPLGFFMFFITFLSRLLYLTSRKKEGEVTEHWTRF